MESPETATDNCDTRSPTTTITTNWTVAGGGASQLNSVVTFESSLTNDSDSTSEAVRSNPLIMYPSTPDFSSSSSPCEITISFPQKHEVRQVYVRSTARTYELYCGPELHGENEYLCTVRCGIATRDEEVLHVTDKVMAGERHGNARNLSSSEDDWVQVKGVDDSVLASSSSLSSGSDRSTGTSSQDLYEATAEINDTNPCKSLTIRLLSLQNKSCVVVDEVYVFADHVESADSDNQVNPMGTSAGNPLMAMLVPTILQLSKSKGLSQLQDKQNAEAASKEKSEAVESKAIDSVAGFNFQQGRKSDWVADRQVVNLQDVNRTSAESVQHETIPQILDAESRAKVSAVHVEVLDMLLSRVGRIEDLVLRFEESMMKPINRIDERLQRVELQLESLMKKSENPVLPSFNRLVAPEFSCGESVSNSFYDGGSTNPIYLASEANKDSPSVLLPTLSDSAATSETHMELHPGLIVTAPDFSHCDDDEENCEVEEEMESLKGKQSRFISVDDALASALAGFMSSATIQSNKFNEELAIKAADFSDDHESNHMVASPLFHDEVTLNPSLSASRPDFINPSRNSSLSVTNKSCLENEENERGSINDGTSDHEVCEQHEQSNSLHFTDNTKGGEVGNEPNNISIPENGGSLEPIDWTGDSCNSTLEGPVSNEAITSKDIIREGSKQDVLQNVLQYTCPASLVDFKTPILDVTFSSHENSSGYIPLEALLDGVSEMKIEASSVNGSVNEDSRNNNQSDLIAIEGWESVVGSQICVDMDYCSAINMFPTVESDQPEDFHAHSSEEMCEVHLI